MELVGRFDRLLDPNPNGSKIDYIPMANNAKANVLLAGLGWSLSENVKVIPNVKYVFYDAPESGDKALEPIFTPISPCISNSKHTCAGEPGPPFFTLPAFFPARMELVINSFHLVLGQVGVDLGGGDG